MGQSVTEPAAEGEPIGPTWGGLGARLGLGHQALMLKAGASLPGCPVPCRGGCRSDTPVIFGERLDRSECLSPDDLSRALFHWPWSVGELWPRILPGLRAEPLGYSIRAQEEQGALSPVHTGVALGSLCLNPSPLL